MAAAARAGALCYRIGPFQLTLRSRLAQPARLVHRLYGDCEVLEPSGQINDFHLQLRRPRTLRRWLRPQVEFVAEGATPFSPLPVESAFPMLEWGLNWCVATTAHQFLMLHAAVVEKNGRAVLMPAFPGSGKSTLCAALVHNGWRLLSDEFGLVRPGSCEYVPFPRCIPLKNESIDLIRGFAPQAVMGPTFVKTRKGDVAHVKPPAESVRRADETARAAYVIFPRYRPGETARLLPIARSRAFMKLCTNSFNYEIMGAAGFTTVAGLIRASECRLCHFSDLDEVLRLFDTLA